MSTNNSIILELQREAADSSISVTSLLRKSKVIATKLGLVDFLKWIDSELKGYDSSELPKYRVVFGIPKGLNPFHGWQSLDFEDAETRKNFSEIPIDSAIPPLENLILKEGKNSSGTLSYSYPPRLKQLLMGSMTYGTDVKVQISRAAIDEILNIVRDTILEWALDLEAAGITGEGLTFSQSEKISAKPVTQNIYASHIGIVSNAYDHSNVVNTQSIQSQFQLSDVKLLVDQIEKALLLFPSEEQVSLKVPLNSIQEQIDKPEPDISKISSAISAIKRICEGITGNVVAEGVISMIGSLFQG
ncbi:hypothetical protein LZF95_19545 [Algoriphagus sp. AGSA1]|uniref:AbiTii domain-containing protein n=1 Tax=Algoriphagus sp. AGSA1 TaxID=2907213 RepID=UPI001F187FA9|nr:hypothetical protein [Algoriphagus sp. AGSA1]MCE7056883.1 hypothetical protein [Algoriphagus sp. AGSA1]